MDDHVISGTVVAAIVTPIVSLITLWVKSYFDYKKVYGDKEDQRESTALSEYKELLERCQAEIKEYRKEVHGLRNDLMVEKNSRAALGIVCAKMTERITTLEYLMKKHAPDVQFTPWNPNDSNASFDIVPSPSTGN